MAVDVAVIVTFIGFNATICTCGDIQFLDCMNLYCFNLYDTASTFEKDQTF